AFVPFGALGVSHRLSLSMKIGTVFGKKADAPASAEPAEIRQKPPAPLPILTAEKTKVDLSKIPFVYRPFTAKTNLRDINPSGIAVFRFEIEDSTGGISVIHGTVRSRSFMARVDFEIGEWTPLPGSHVSGMEVVRYFNVKKNFAEEVIGAEITLRLPKADIVRGQGKIYVQLLDGSGTIIEPEISEEGEYLYYRFRLDKLSPFAVVKQGRNPIKN
ncbi:MAG: hypothetical protein KJ967_04190, partial [Elusimicrobia bacterium]|nr:hypothetical protein [Elusimicrobiota bacterium]